MVVRIFSYPPFRSQSSFSCPSGNGENLSDGSFAEFIMVKAHINIKLTDWMSFEDGATLAVGITTVAQGMYQQLKLPLPSLTITPTAGPGTEPILIYGGSTATGTLAIQFAKLYETPSFRRSGLFSFSSFSNKVSGLDLESSPPARPIISH